MFHYKFGHLVCALKLCLLFAFIVGPSPRAQAEPVAVPPLIRLHVIANSDDAADQEVKAAVSADILGYLSATPVAHGASLQEAKDFLEGHVGTIEALARKRLAAEGVRSEVIVRFGVYEYSERRLDPYVVRAGEYLSLEVVLGDGEGQNFWCIIFPAMCFVPEEVQSLDRERSRGNVAEAAERVGDERTEEEPETPKATAPFSIRWRLFELLSW